MVKKSSPLWLNLFKFTIYTHKIHKREIQESLEFFCIACTIASLNIWFIHIFFSFSSRLFYVSPQRGHSWVLDFQSQNRVYRNTRLCLFIVFKLLLCIPCLWFPATFTYISMYLLLSPPLPLPLPLPMPPYLILPGPVPPVTTTV